MVARAVAVKVTVAAVMAVGAVTVTVEVVMTPMMESDRRNRCSHCPRGRQNT